LKVGNGNQANELLLSFCILFKYTAFYWLVFKYTAFYWLVFKYTAFYWLVFKYTAFYWLIFKYTAFYWLKHTVIYWFILYICWLILTVMISACTALRDSVDLITHWFIV